MLLEVIAPLTSSECLCCSSTMHSEQTVVEVYIVGPWVFFLCVKDPNFITSHVHLHFVLRITLEVWNARHSSQHDLKTEINIKMEMVDMLSCIVHGELPVEKVFIRSQSWWKRVMTNNFRTEQWVKCWHGKSDLFYTKRASRKKPSLLRHWRKKSLSTFPYRIAPMSIEKAWRPTWHYKTLLKLVGVKQ